MPPPPSRPLPPTPHVPEVEDDDEEEVEFIPKKRNDGTLLASDPPRPMPEMGPSRPLPPTPEENQGTLVTRRPARQDGISHGPRTSVLPDLLPQTSSDPDVSRNRIELLKLL